MPPGCVTTYAPYADPARGDSRPRRSALLAVAAVLAVALGVARVFWAKSIFEREMGP